VTLHILLDSKIKWILYIKKLEETVGLVSWAGKVSEKRVLVIIYRGEALTESLISEFIHPIHFLCSSVLPKTLINSQADERLLISLSRLQPYLLLMYLARSFCRFNEGRQGCS
jgi:hypothetical protein